MHKKRHIALQMDHPSRINIQSDSTFLLGLGAQELGHSLYFYEAHQLTWREGRLIAPLQPLTFRREAGNHFTLGPPVLTELARAVDVILLRQDPPFDMGYITATYMLDTIKEEVRIINDPTGVRSAPEKMLITHFPSIIPPTLVTADWDEARQFAAQHGEVVAKRLYGNAGKDVFRFKAGDSMLQELLQQNFAERREPIMLQPFLPDIVNGDKRIILFDGKPVAAMRRVPAKGNFLANIAQGATAQICEMTDQDRLICSTIEPSLKSLGIYFSGIDIIQEKLIEINVTSPTGLQGVNRLYDLKDNKRMEMLFWKGLEFKD